MQLWPRPQWMRQLGLAKNVIGQVLAIPRETTRRLHASWRLTADNPRRGGSLHDGSGRLVSTDARGVIPRNPFAQIAWCDPITVMKFRPSMTREDDFHCLASAGQLVVDPFAAGLPKAYDSIDSTPYVMPPSMTSTSSSASLAPNATSSGRKCSSVGCARSACGARRR